MVSELDHYDRLGYCTADSEVDLHRLAGRRNNVLGLFMACIFRSRVRFPAIAALRFHHDFARQPAGSGIRAATRRASGKKFRARCGAQKPK